MSLRTRLSVIISLLFFTGMILGVSFQVGNARQRVAQEMESVATLTYQLLDSVLLNTDLSADTGKSRLLGQLQGLQDVRHLDVSISSRSDNTRHSVNTLPAANAPRWFVYLVQTAPVEIVRPLNNALEEVLVIRTNPADEIAEVWLESKNFMLVLLLVLLPLNGFLYFTIGQWFKPVKLVVAGLEDVEQGNFSGHIPQASLPELKVIVEKLNHLTTVLRTSKTENDRLTRHSLQIQEQERQHLARELHDEMGQSISAIKAIAFSIAERTRASDQVSAQGATKIGSITSHMSGHVRSMMQRLRPAILDELGLIIALQHMVDAWNDNHRETFCSFRVSQEFGRLDANQQICVYRIIQEALTNVASHAEAEQVDVNLSYEKGYLIEISDNGCGFALDAMQQGMGISGLRERSHALHGQCTISTSPGNGVRIVINFPDPGLAS